MSLYSFKYGKGTVSIDLEGKVQTILTNKSGCIQDIKSGVVNAIENPIGTKPLGDIVKPGENVLIVVSDITRAWIKTSEFLIHVVNYLNSFGVEDKNVSVIIATGAHRPASDEEKKCIVGEELYRRIKIYNHDVTKKDEIEYIGVSSYGTPEYINKKVIEADRVILTGGIGFHVFAGFGGGGKSIVPGTAGIETILNNHSLTINKGEDAGLNLNARVNNIEGNHVRADITEICRKVSPDFLINAVLDTHGDFVKFVAGDFEKAWLQGCEAVRNLYGVKIQHKADITIASAGGYPKDIDLYQSVKTIDNSLHASGGGSVVIIIAQCTEGLGSDEFAKWLEYETLEDLGKALRKDFTVPGFVAYKALHAAKTRKVLLLSSLDDDIVNRFGFIPINSLEEGIKIAYKLSNFNPNIILMPYGGNTLPLL